MELVEVFCDRCGMSAPGYERNGKRRVKFDRRLINCAMLFKAGVCPYWDKAIIKAWLEYDGMIGDDRRLK